MSVTDQIWFTLSLGGVLIMFEGVATWAAYKINSRRSKDKKREYMEKASETAVKIPVGMALFFFFLFSWLVVDKERFVEIFVIAIIGIALTLSTAFSTFKPIE